MCPASALLVCRAQLSSAIGAEKRSKSAQHGEICPSLESSGVGLMPPDLSDAFVANQTGSTRTRRVLKREARQPPRCRKRRPRPALTLFS